jgi:hypothetical protein
MVAPNTGRIWGDKEVNDKFPRVVANIYHGQKPTLIILDDIF